MVGISADPWDQQLVFDEVSGEAVAVEILMDEKSGRGYMALLELPNLGICSGDS